jgi:GT2 family glycosyltransferase
MLLFSVIIPTYHRNEALMRCLGKFAPGEQDCMVLFDSISATPKLQSFNSYEVIVTDDGSLSTAECMLREVFPWAQWVSGPKRGPAANRNHGAKRASGDWLVFVDDDCVPAATLLAAYRRATAAGDYAVLEGMTVPQGDREAADLECPVNISGGRLWSCNFALKRSLFMDLSGFDENFSIAMEDIDMQTRLSKAGYTTLLVSEARVLHPWRPRKDLKFLKLCASNISYFVKKHPESRRYWSLSNLLKRAGRALLLEFPSNLVRFRGKGASRALLLDLVFVALLIKCCIDRISFRHGSRAP